jgi:cytochrome c-type biogenesis protein CcmH
VKALIASMVALVALALPAWAVAAECTPKTSVADLEDEVMCPVCGTSLGLAREAPQARRERAYIARLVRRCHSKVEIKAALVAQFGDSVLALPDDEGFNLSAYLAPLLGLLAAGTGIGWALVRWRRAGTRAAAAVVAGSLKEEDVRRLDTEIRLDERRGP